MKVEESLRANDRVTLRSGKQLLSKSNVDNILANTVNNELKSPIKGILR